MPRIAINSVSVEKYVSLDSTGRIVRYPEAGRYFIRAHKAALAFFALYPKAMLHLGSNSFDYPYVSSLEEYRAANMQLLDKRISLAGNLTIREPRDGTWELKRDQRAMEDLLIRRIRHYGLETKTAQQRFPEIHARMKSRD